MAGLYRAIHDIEHPRIVGVDLPGDEVHSPPEHFGDFFREINADSVYRGTIHAEEVIPASQIWNVLRDLGACRIGHGLGRIADSELQHFLADNDIVLEQCIAHDYQTGSWANERHHPLGTLYRAGVPVTTNSDDRTIQNVTLTDHYLKAIEYSRLHRG